MAKGTMYRQCRLRQRLDDQRCREQIGYIPEPHCRLNQVLRLRDAEGLWEVVEVSETACEESHIDRLARSYRYYRMDWDRA